MSHSLECLFCLLFISVYSTAFSLEADHPCFCFDTNFLCGDIDLTRIPEIPSGVSVLTDK